MIINSLKENLLKSFPGKSKMRAEKDGYDLYIRLQISDEAWKKLILELI